MVYGISLDKLIRKEIGILFKFGIYGYYFRIYNVKVRRIMLNIIRSVFLRDFGLIL